MSEENLLPSLCCLYKTKVRFLQVCFFDIIEEYSKLIHVNGKAEIKLR